MNNKVVVLGSNYSSLLGMVRAVGSAGYEVDVVKVSLIESDDLVSSSRYVKNYYVLNTEDPEELRDFLYETYSKEKQKPVLIPIMDQIVKSLDLYYDELKKSFIISNVDETQGGIIALMNKRIQKRLAEQCGFQVAREWEIIIRDCQFEIPDDITFPCFTKAISSINGGKTFIKRCNSNEELINELEKAANRWKNVNVLVEEYKVIQQEYGVLGCCLSCKTFLPALVTKLSIGKGEHIGVTIQGKISPIEKAMPGLREKLEAFLSNFSYTGLCDFDLYMADGQLFFNEMNLRYGGFGYAVVEAGVNLPKIYVDHVFGNTPNDQEQYIKETVCLSDKANLESFISGYSNLKEYNVRKKQSVFRFIKDKKDPVPAKIFRKIELKEMTKSLLKHTPIWWFVDRFR